MDRLIPVGQRRLVEESENWQGKYPVRRCRSRPYHQHLGNSYLIFGGARLHNLFRHGDRFHFQRYFKGIGFTVKLRGKFYLCCAQLPDYYRKTGGAGSGACLYCWEPFELSNLSGSVTVPFTDIVPACPVLLVTETPA